MLPSSRRLLASAVVGLAITAAAADAAVVLIDFGAATTPTVTDALGRRWNNVDSGNDQSGSPFVLNTTDAVPTDSGYRLTVTNPPTGVTNPVGYNGVNENGTTAPTGDAALRGYPATATRDSLYGNATGAPFGNLNVEAVRLVLSNLNPNETYDLDFFASRTGVTDNRQTQYVVTGANSATALLNAANNTGTIAGVDGIVPDQSGQIIIDMTAGPANTNTANKFFYLGVLEINSNAVPEPASITLLSMGGGLALLARRRRAE